MRTKIFATRTDLSSASQPAVRARATAGRAQQRRLRGGRARLCRLGDPHDSSPRACAYPCLTGLRGSPHPVCGTGAVVGVGCDVCGTGERFERRPRRRQRSSATGSGRPASRRCSARRKARSGAAGSAGQRALAGCARRASGLYSRVAFRCRPLRTMDGGSCATLWAIGLVGSGPVRGQDGGGRPPLPNKSKATAVGAD